ncbi:MBL fold metallo-hydrolase [Cryptosporangium aurantiacum]|uniref:Glyoxylase, beta-lactamase superfamily II n=1 Tax=Cryptosporangium aurantiacum TaxID=134849 RepID=A0A1M7IIN1_9ACTN|nr:MBL fold metallo-hydrolase [Cryptosporangium aurantiacum]SHM40529.1 Glyoxylase, beta-lactamase superfamily II [Cryptosporangium aurantiacum]
MSIEFGYTGHVDPQGAPATRDAGPLTITKVSVGPMDNNAYFLRSTATGEALLIDAANDAGTLLRLLGDAELTTVVTTHRHADHWQALAEVAKETGARLVAHPADAESLPVVATDLVDDGDTVTVGDVTLDVIHLVGHTPGAIALLYREPGGHPHLFTGDSLFPGGPGRTTSPEDFTSLMNHLERKVFGRLPDDTWVYPGHGDDTTLGAERPHLGEWRERGW